MTIFWKGENFCKSSLGGRASLTLLNLAMPAKLNLCKRKIVDDAKCPFCINEDESTTHILWECECLVFRPWAYPEEAYLK